MRTTGAAAAGSSHRHLLSSSRNSSKLSQFRFYSSGAGQLVHSHTVNSRPEQLNRLQLGFLFLSWSPMNASCVPQVSRVRVLDGRTCSTRENCNDLKMPLPTCIIGGKELRKFVAAIIGLALMANKHTSWQAPALLY